MSKKHAFVKYTKKGKLIPGSLVITSAYPKETANGVWEEVPMNLFCCDPITTTTTVAPSILRMLFSNITEVDAIIGDSSNVSDWNTYFDLPTYGSPFTSVSVVGNEVQLVGGFNIILKQGLFDQVDQLGTYLLEIEDTYSIIEAESAVFSMSYNFGCENLTTVILPNLQTVGDECFAYCYALQTISIPLVVNFSYGMFSYCTALITVNFPNVLTIGGSCFYNCTSITSATFSSATSIDDLAFDGCTSLLSVSAPQLVSAGANSFSNCTLLTTINLPSLNTIGFACFYNCTSLVTVNLASVTTDLGSTFTGCNSLTTINLPLATTIGYASFADCFALTSINLSSCTSLGNTVGNDSVFFNITGNTITLTIPSALMTINGGNPDGDIQYLQSNDTLTVVTV